MLLLPKEPLDLGDILLFATFMIHERKWPETFNPQPVPMSILYSFTCIWITFTIFLRSNYSCRKENASIKSQRIDSWSLLISIAQHWILLTEMIWRRYELPTLSGDGKAYIIAIYRPASFKSPIFSTFVRLEFSQSSYVWYPRNDLLQISPVRSHQVRNSPYV